eukprot:CAMPEP_0119305864 /NCGR_PEP_ID=MMETSP1333-20130426/6752_1 /TAXON_ID=418940 /ORGANISM="Scyphosphaera apsteinii, Strain RCC1455" /LENGTH=422 /DNA_ID=CAMNT_0007309045 /DNA_START=90 /DNA_END=1358 /DNA_ORIENTATION=-
MELDTSFLPAHLTAEAKPRVKGTKKAKGKDKKRNKLAEQPERTPEDDTTSFPRLQHCCSLCGIDPASDSRWQCCAKCGETRYCGRACQVEAWKQPCAHKVSCGHRLPTPNVIAESTTVEAATILHEFARADASLAEAAVARLAELLAQAAAQRNEGHDAGAAAAVVVAMAAHTTSVCVQRDGCVAIGYAALGKKEFKQAIVSAGGAEAIINAMESHINSAEVQLKGCWALRNVALGAAAVQHNNNTTTQQAVVAAGGAVAAIAALRSPHSGDTALATEAFAALANMAGGDSGCQTALLGAGAAQAIVGRMMRVESSCPVDALAPGGPTNTLAATAPSEIQEQQLQAQGCAALGNLAGGDVEGQRKVIDAGGALAVVAAIRAWSEADGVQQGGKAALTNMAFGIDELRELVLSTPGIDPTWLE